MKQLYFLDEEEKNRILNLHESATKRHYLGEQQTGAKFIYNNPNDRAYDYKMENGKYYFKGKEGTTDKKAQKYTDWYESKADRGIKAIKALFDAGGTNVTTTEIKPATNTQVKPVTQTDPSKAATVTANTSVTTPTTSVTTTPAAGPTTPAPAVTNTGSGVISVNANDIIATPETGTETPAVAGTQGEKPTVQFKPQTLPDLKGYTAPKPA